MSDTFVQTMTALRDGKPQAGLPDTLTQIGISRRTVLSIDRFAWEMAYGGVEDYIDALADPSRVNPGQRVILFGDLWGNVTWAGTIDPSQVKFPIESCVKHLLQSYAIKMGEKPEDISGVAQTNLAFMNDRLLDPQSGLDRPDNAVNNAGAISSSGGFAKIEADKKILGDLVYKLLILGETDIKAEFDRFIKTYFTSEQGFLTFVRKLAGDETIDIDMDVFVSEYISSFNNLAIANRNAAVGRFNDFFQTFLAHACYIAACSINLTPKNLLDLNLVYAAGGMDLKTRLANYEPGQAFFDPDFCLIDPNSVVFADNALNVAGLYEGQPRMNLLVSGARATTMKSGVGGGIGAILPGVGSVVTFHTWTRPDGNSAYGCYGHIGANEATADSSVVPVRLSPEELHRQLMIQRENDIHGVVNRLRQLKDNGREPQMGHAPLDMLKEAKSRGIITAAEFRTFRRWGKPALRKRGLLRRAVSGAIRGLVKGKKIRA